MSALTKVIDEAASAAAKASRVDKAVEVASATGTARAASTVQRDLRVTLDDVLREQKEVSVADGIQAELDAASGTMRAERDADAISEREHRLFSSTNDTGFHRFQTENSEEFGRRLNEQLVDPEFSRRVVGGVDVGFPANAPVSQITTDQIRNKQGIDDVFQMHMGLSTLGPKNPRVHARAKAWSGDTPYTSGDNPKVFVHIDRQTDPTRMGQDAGYVQFERPNELGMHSGTNTAAQSATIRSTSAGMQSMADLDSMLDEIVGLSDEPAITKQLLIETMEEGLYNRFLEKPDISQAALYDGLAQDLETVGIPTDDVVLRSMFGRMKTVPTASSTPHLFRGKNGLYLRDEGGFGPETVGAQLLELFPEQADEIHSILGSGSRNKGLQQFIEKQGFDHVVYHNAVEDKGTLSIINWNEDLFMSLYDPRLAGNKPQDRAAAMAAFTMSSLGLGAAGLQEGG